MRQIGHDIMLRRVIATVVIIGVVLAENEFAPGATC
jgi:hypothetical protein